MSINDVLDNLYERLMDCDCEVDNMCPKCKDIRQMIDQLIEDEEIDIDEEMERRNRD